MDLSTVYFDDICILCSRAVKLIIRNDPRGRFRFTATNSETIALYHKGKTYKRSSAVLHIAIRLRFPWPLAGLFFIVPRFIRDPLYNWVARNRYKWFGKGEVCFMPDEARERML